MEFTKDTLLGLSTEYKKACKSLDMWLRKNYGKCYPYNASYNRGEMSDCRGSYWFTPPFGSGWNTASVKIDGHFGIMAWRGDKTYRIEAAIPCDKLRWELKEVIY